MPSAGEDSQLPFAKHSCEKFLPSCSPPVSHLDLQYCRPKFSIRDYVHSMRSKSIKDNWPFSSKTLQLCIKHRVKDVLPSFHNPLDKTGGSLNKSSIDGCEDNSSCKYVDENEILFSGSEASQQMTESPLALFALSSPRSRKNSLNIAKKRRIILKVSGKPGSEESAWGSTDSMASKVCPVCKAFSSSSNTTLNAHIDQCLSAQATPLIADGCKLPRQKRKKRLMTDVYATAKHCTVEDLELRNGIRRVASTTANQDESNSTKLKKLSEEEALRCPVFVLGNNPKGRRSSRAHNKKNDRVHEDKALRKLPNNDVESNNLVVKTNQEDKSRAFNVDRERFPVTSEKRRRKLYRSSRAIVDKARRFCSFRRRILGDSKIKEEVFSDKRIDDCAAADFSTFSTMQYDFVAPELEIPGGFCITDAFEESSLPTVDPISIPGPPGSYLPPSPEDFHVENSRVQSSIDMPEVLDGDSSDSPISAASTISNSVRHGCDNSRVHTVQENPAALRVGAFSQPVERGSHSEGGFDLLKNEQHCCCQRKEMCINYEDLESVRRRSMNSPVEPPSNGGFPNLSSSNPILRLMGKNLMVVNKHDDSTAMMHTNLQQNCLASDNVRAGAALSFSDRSSYGLREHHWLRESLPMPSSFSGSGSYGPGLGLPRSHLVAAEAPNLNQRTRTSEFSSYGGHVGTSSPSHLYPFAAPEFYYRPPFGFNFLRERSPPK